MCNVLLIVNPVAGKLRAKTALFDIVEALNTIGCQLNVQLTQRRGHAREMARNAKRNLYDRVICVGGDGTLNEVITGMLESGEQIPLGYIPLGSTNDFASTMQLPKDVVSAAQAALQGSPFSLDVGDFCGERKFSYIASFGVFTAASYSAPQATKNAIGHLAYILEGVKDVLNVHSYAMTIEAEGKTIQDEFLFGAVSNSTSIGGIVRLDQEIVDLADGLFEIVLVRKIHNPAELNQVLVSVLNSDFNNHMFEFIRTSRAVFHTEKPINWSLDGEEATGSTTTVIQNLHGAITFYK